MRFTQGLVFSVVAMLFTGTIGFAAPIEDGSSFSGDYQVQERACERVIFSYRTGEEILDPNFTFRGLPTGLKVHDTFIPVEAPNTFDQGHGIFTGGYAKYVSSTVFVRETSLIHPNIQQGQKVVTTETYSIDRFGTIVKTTVVAVGNGPSEVTKVCTFVRK